MSDIIKIKEEYLNKLKDNLDLNDVNQLKSELFGKNGIISNEFKKMGSISAGDRKNFASDLNSIKNEFHHIIITLVAHDNGKRTTTSSDLLIVVSQSSSLVLN